MASIKRRRGKYHVVYYYLNEDGEKKQKWESFDTEAEAKHRKAEIEYKQGSRTFIAPSKTTVAAFLEDFVSLYGTKKWSPSTYEANTGLIRNYINPKLGSTLMQDVTSIAADRFISALQRTKCPTYKNRYSKTEYMTPANIERINKLLRCAFGQAVRWDIMQLNFRVSSEELAVIEQKMSQLGTSNREAYLRKMALDGYVVKLDLPELKELVSLMRRSSNNLNQLTRKVHETGRVYDADLKDISQRQELLWEGVKEILTQLSKLS